MGFEAEGELYVNKRRRLGVDGGPLLDETGTGRVGECGRRGEGGVTSECRIELNIALACSVVTGRMSHDKLTEPSEARTFECIRFRGYYPVLGRYRRPSFINEMITRAHISNIARWDESIAIFAIGGSTGRYTEVYRCFWTCAAVAGVCPRVQGGRRDSEYWVNPLACASRSVVRVLLRSA